MTAMIMNVQINQETPTPQTDSKPAVENESPETRNVAISPIHRNTTSRRNEFIAITG